MSDADPRERHRAVSHHALTAFGRVALVTADLVVPAGLPAELAQAVAADLAPLAERHRIVTIATDGLEAALQSLMQEGFWKTNHATTRATRFPSGMQDADSLPFQEKLSVADSSPLTILAFPTDYPAVIGRFC